MNDRDPMSGSPRGLEIAWLRNRPSSFSSDWTHTRDQLVHVWAPDIVGSREVTLRVSQLASSRLRAVSCIGRGRLTGDCQLSMFAFLC